MLEAILKTLYPEWHLQCASFLIPEGPTYTTIMELGPQNQNRDGFFSA